MAEAQHADALALRGTVLAEQDIATFSADRPGSAARAFGGAILGGILIDHGGRIGLASFGGTATRGRHHVDAGDLGPLSR
jgi:hypothetical protein